MIMGDGKVGLIPCDLDCINGVDSSLHFFFFESFVLILGILKKIVLGDGGGRWIVVGGGRL